MKSTKTISIVVPIYNVEAYLPNCLDSIIAQTYANIEIILVDDGSPDQCGAICDRYAASDDRIRVFHIPNGGVAKARRLGFERATGEYIMFVDPDDWLALDSAEVLYSHIANDDDLDIVVGSYNELTKRSAIIPTINKSAIFDQDAWIKKLLIKPAIDSAAPWGRIYRRGLFAESSFPDMRRTQDWLMNLELSMRVRRVKTISVVTYNYRAPIGKRFNTDIAYLKQLCGVAYDILQRNNRYERYKKEFLCMKLSFIYERTYHEDKISCKDPWIREVYDALKDEELIPRHRLTIKAIKHPPVRYGIWIYVRLRAAYRLIHGAVSRIRG